MTGFSTGYIFAMKYITLLFLLLTYATHGLAAVPGWTPADTGQVFAQDDDTGDDGSGDDDEEEPDCE